MGKWLYAGLLAFAVSVSGTAYAEVQNIRVSGDIDLKGVSQHNYDLKNKQINNPGGGLGAGANAVTNDDEVNFLLSTVHLQVDADLTDNVSATVQLVNQRVWDGENNGAGDNQIGVDQAYVVLREFLYSPVTVIAGRQDLQYGTGFIVGAGILADPEGTFGTLATGVSPHTTQGQEFSDFNSYDAIRVILDFAPLTIEGVWAKINETGVADDDEDLYGALVNYKLDQWEAEIEPYWFFKKSESGRAGATVTTADADLGGAGVNRTYETNKVHAVGLRTSASPIANLVLSGEGAFQFGELADATIEQERDREAWGATIDARYHWADVKWTPTTGIGWVYYSGEESESVSNGADASDDFDAWDPMFRGQFHTYIQDFFSGLDSTPSLYTTFDANDTAATTNRHLFYFDVGAQPLEDVSIWARYTHARFAEAPISGRDEHAGDELDAKVVYNYTEDVSLAAWGGWFLPGDYYSGQSNTNTRGDDLAWTAGASGSVKF